jgi:hypothetical protein
MSDDNFEQASDDDASRKYRERIARQVWLGQQIAFARRNTERLLSEATAYGALGQMTTGLELLSQYQRERDDLVKLEAELHQFHDEAGASVGASYSGG